MKNCPKVFVIVLNYNGRETLLKCLSSVYQSDYPDFETVVVDNASTDGSLESAKKDFSKAHFVRNSHNLGFAAGNNAGIRFALEKFADYVLVLNNDAYLERNAVSLLVEALEKDGSAGIASPFIAKENGESWFAGGSVRWLTMKTRHWLKPVSEEPYASPFITGCAMLVKKDVFKKIGLFDERFFLYYEDADFSVRAKKAAFGLLVVPAAKASHAEKSENDKAGKAYWLVISGLMFFRKNAPFYLKPWLCAYVAARKTKNVSSVLFSKNPLAREVRKAYLDFKKTSS